MAILELSGRDIGRLLVGVRSRIQKLEKGIAKFGDEFDPDKGKNMTDALEAYSDLQHRLKEAAKDAKDDHTCEPTTHRDER